MMDWWNDDVFQCAFGGTRSVASGHDEAWPSKTWLLTLLDYSNIPSFHYSSGFQH
jgi:hypothetical protein